MTPRFEIFPDDLDATVDFYVRVLRFRLTVDQRDEPAAYVSLQRGSMRIGAARRVTPNARAARLPPAGVELVLEVDDVVAERARVIAAGWPLAEDLRDRPWARPTSGFWTQRGTTRAGPDGSGRRTIT